MCYIMSAARISYDSLSSRCFVKGCRELYVVEELISPFRNESSHDAVSLLKLRIPLSPQMPQSRNRMSRNDPRNSIPSLIIM